MPPSFAGYFISLLTVRGWPKQQGIVRKRRFIVAGELHAILLQLTKTSVMIGAYFPEDAAKLLALRFVAGSRFGDIFSELDARLTSVEESKPFSSPIWYAISRPFIAELFDSPEREVDFESQLEQMEAVSNMLLVLGIFWGLSRRSRIGRSRIEGEILQERWLSSVAGTRYEESASDYEDIVHLFIQERGPIPPAPPELEATLSRYVHA